MTTLHHLDGGQERSARNTLHDTASHRASGSIEYKHASSVQNVPKPQSSRATSPLEKFLGVRSPTSITAIIIPYTHRSVAGNSLVAVLRNDLRRDGGEVLLERTDVHLHQPRPSNKRTCKHAPQARSGAPTASRGQPSTQRTSPQTSRTQTRRRARRPPRRCRSSRPRGGRAARTQPGRRTRTRTRRWSTPAPTRGCC